MPLTAATLATALRTAVAELRTLRAFIDDLDGWDGEDCDTGTNALLTVTAMARAVEAADESTPLDAALDLAAEEGLRSGVGHVGVLLSVVVSAWAQALPPAAPVTPVVLRRMLHALPWEAEQCHLTWTEAVESMFDEATAELDVLGDSLLEETVILSRFSAQSQYGLVDATSERTGRVDAGAAVLAVLIACLDSAVREDHAMLASLAQMLADLTGSPGASSPRPQPPAPDRAFTVDVVLDGTVEDAAAARRTLDGLGVRYSCVGRADAFGVGEWRMHVDTSAPLAVRPRAGVVRRLQVRDARPDESIGQDALSDGVTHRGVRLLERRTLSRVERASVVALTRVPGLVEDLAQAGAVVLLDPEARDIPGVVLTETQRSSTGVCLVAPCDEESASACRRPGSELAADEFASAPAVLVAGSRDDLSVLSVAQACGTVFVPQPGGREAAGLLRSVLVESSAQALANSWVVSLPALADAAVVAEAAHETLAAGPRTCRVLVSREDGPVLVALLRQILAGAAGGSSVPDLVVMDGGQTGPSLLQGVR